MVDLYSAVGTTAILTLVGLCWKQSWNGKKTNNSNCNPNYVKRDDCHRAMDAQDGRISDLKSHLDTRFEDLKDFIKNGK